MIHIPENPRPEPPTDPDQICPVCSEALESERCKVICRSDVCTYRVIFNCTEF